MKKSVYSTPFSLPPCLTTSCSEIASLRNTLKQNLLDSLETSYAGKHFTLSDVMGLQNSCLASVSGTSVIRGEDAKQEFSSLVQELPWTGLIIPAIGVGKQRETKYEVSVGIGQASITHRVLSTIQVLRPKKHLCPVILEYIRKKEKIESKITIDSMIQQCYANT